MAPEVTQRRATVNGEPQHAAAARPGRGAGPSRRPCSGAWGRRPPGTRSRRCRSNPCAPDAPESPPPPDAAARLRRLHHDRGLHERVRLAEVRVGPGLGERVRGRLAGLQDPAVERAVVRGGRVRRRPVVHPGDGVALVDGERAGREAEVGDRHASRWRRRSPWSAWARAPPRSRRRGPGARAEAGAGAGAASVAGLGRRLLAGAGGCRRWSGSSWARIEPGSTSAHQRVERCEQDQLPHAGAHPNGYADSRRAVQRSRSRFFLPNSNRAVCTLPSSSFSTNSRQVPAHSPSVLQSIMYLSERPSYPNAGFFLP